MWSSAGDTPSLYKILRPPGRPRKDTISLPFRLSERAAPLFTETLLKNEERLWRERGRKLYTRWGGREVTSWRKKELRDRKLETLAWMAWSG